MELVNLCRKCVDLYTPQNNPVACSAACAAACSADMRPVLQRHNYVSSRRYACLALARHCSALTCSLAVEQGYRYLLMAFQRSVRAISLKRKSQVYNSLPEHPGPNESARITLFGLLE